MKTTSRSFVLGALSLLVVPAVTLGVLALRPPAARDVGVQTAPAAEHASLVHVAWPKGREARYEFIWEGDTHVDLSAGKAAAIDASYRLSGRLVVRSLGEERGGALLAISIASLDEHSLRALGTELLPTPEAARVLLEGREAWIRVDPTGTVETTLFTPSDPGPWKDVVRAIASHLSVTMPTPEQATWTASEITDLGRAETHYERSGSRGEALRRVRTRYDQLFAMPADACPGCAPVVTSRGTVVLDDDGAIVSIDEGDRVVVGPSGGEPTLRARSVFQLARVDVVDIAVASSLVVDLTQLEARTLAQRDDDKPSLHAMLTRRIGGLTERDLAAAFDLYSQTGKLPPTPGFLIRATGLLLADPTLCGALAKKFALPDTPIRGRALALDLLASAGSKEAQAAMREALSSPAALREPSAYPLLFQRLSLIAKPDAETAAFVRRAYSRAAGGEKTTRDATAYALASVAGHLARNGNEGDARALVGGLRADLGRAESPRDRAALIGALGGTRLPELATELGVYTNDPSNEVREATARALGDVHTPAARTALLAMATDDDTDVQLTAWKALDGQELRREDLAALGARVTSGATSPTNDARLVGFLANHADEGGEVRAMLTYLLSRTTDLRLAGRIRFVLSQLA